MQYELIAPRNKAKSAIEQVLNNRGIVDIQHYLKTTEADINSPLLLENMANGAEMLVSHIKVGDKAYIQIDCDCDGWTSASLLINYLTKAFPDWTKDKLAYNQHSGKQHGIELNLVPEDVKLVIVPDAGSNDVEQFAELASRGIETLCLD